MSKKTHRAKQRFLRGAFSHIVLVCLVVTGSTYILTGCASTEQGVGTCGAGARPGEFWHLALKSPILDLCSGTSVQSFALALPPVVMQEDGVFKLAFCVPCSHERSVTYKVAQSEVRELTYSADTKTPTVPVDAPEACIHCSRERRAFSWLHKIEVRAMGAYRGTQSPVFYPDASGGITYQPKTFGFDRGGTKIAVGGELALLWDVVELSRNSDIQLGVMGGVWPVDGSTFLPLSFHPRITFNNHPDRYADICTKSGWCDAVYLFGDVGWVNLGNSPAYYAELTKRRFFYGIGIGYEMALGRDVDLALDAGYRFIHTPLPPLECCPDVPGPEREPIRETHNFFMRLGLTF